VQYYYLKVGPGNSFASVLLQDQVLGAPVVAGFYKNITLEDLRQQPADQRPRFSQQLLDLYRWSIGEITGFAVVVAQGYLYILKPSGEMYDLDRKEFSVAVGATPSKDDIPKIVPVTICHRQTITHVPMVLAQINANRSLSSSSFKRIKDDFGTVLALNHILFKGGLVAEYPPIPKEQKTILHVLLCLDTNELIALVARLMEEQGLFVPAPSGGFMKNVDLFIYNEQQHDITIGGLTVPARSSFRSGAAALQIRGFTRDTEPQVAPEVDCLIQLSAAPSIGGPGNRGMILNGDWIIAILRGSPRTQRWLARTVRWVPFAGRAIQQLHNDLQQPA
jgi:hypothetical protein